MTERPADEILAEWRELDMALAAKLEAQDRIDLERALTSLADEYREALGAQGRVAEPLNAAT